MASEYSDEELPQNPPQDSMGNDRPESDSSDSEDDMPEQAPRSSLKQSTPAPVAANKPYIAGMFHFATVAAIVGL